MEVKRLGERLRELRGKRTQEEVSKILGLSRARYSHYENNRVEPDSEILNRIADYFSVTTDYLLGRSDNKEEVQSVKVAGREVSLTEEEFLLFSELKKHPIMFHDLASDPEAKVKELIKLYKMKKIFFEDDEEDPGDGFGQFED